jgi:AcrR family transcriptional regulator
MNRKKIREQAVRDVKSNIILDAALAVFAEKGFHETRLEDIAEEAGFSKASLYNYYESKEVIFLNLVVREHERLVEAVKGKIDLSKSLEENLVDIFNTIFSYFGRHFAFILTISHFRTMSLVHFESLYKNHKHLLSSFEKSTQRVPELLVTLLRAARERGEIESSLDDEKLAKYISSLIRGILIEWKIRGKMGDIDEEITYALSFIKRGLGKG